MSNRSLWSIFLFNVILYVHRNSNEERSKKSSRGMSINDDEKFDENFKLMLNPINFMILCLGNTKQIIREAALILTSA